MDKFRFYTPQLHSAAFVLPAFVTKVIDQARAEAETEKKTSAVVAEHKAADAADGESSTKKQKTEA